MPEDVVVPADAAADFAAYVEARSPALRRLAHLVTGDLAESSDLVQEALERAWPRWAALVEAGTCEAYLRRSISNGAVSRWRKLGRVTPVAEPVEVGTAEVVGDPSAGGAASGTSDADEAWLLCAELPPLQRAAVVLRFYEDLSYAEIAEVLECAEATARSHVHRALTALRRRLTPGVVDG